MADVVEVDVCVPHRAPLAGMELKEFLAREEGRRLKEKARQEKLAMLREVELVRDRLRLNEQQDEVGTNANNAVSSTSGDGDGTGNKNSRSAPGGEAQRPRQRRRFDANLFLKYSKPCHSESLLFYLLWRLPCAHNSNIY